VRQSLNLVSLSGRCCALAQQFLSNCLAPVSPVWQRVGVTPAASSRRIGAVDSKTRVRLVDAAELLLLEEGYAAVTSRRVAARAGLKPQLVHYYFRTMDDLFLEVFRRRAEENLARVEQAIATDGSLRVLWQLNADPRGARFNIEFVALANHRKAIRNEIARYAERFRAAQLEAVTQALTAVGVTDDELPPIVALLVITGLTQVMALEDALGVTTGHDSTRTFIERSIARVDGTSVDGRPGSGD
jgi:TetR/AcrR family transcriptional regulator